MPLPALPPNNTGRVWFKYVTGAVATSQEHEVMIRYPVGGSVDDVAEQFEQFLSGLGTATFRVGWRVLSARYSEAGEVFSLPRDLPTALESFEGTATTPTYNPRYEAVERVFAGRSVLSGRRVDFSLYTALSDADDTFRGLFPGTPYTILEAAYSNGAFACIDGTRASWYPYINFNYNSYWERRLRS